jgi:hypothetical protein
LHPHGRDPDRAATPFLSGLTEDLKKVQDFATGCKNYQA